MDVPAGRPACVLIGIVAYRYLDDKPAQAKWLSAEEKALLAADLDARSGQQKHAFRQVLRDPAIYGMALTYFCLICGIYAVSFWLPTLLKLAGVKDTMEIGLYSAVPYIAAAAFMLLFARSSDRMQERRWHTLVPALLAGVALCVATTAPTQFALSLAAITLATGFMWASYTVFWAIPSQYLKGEAAAGGIALINSIGLLGGFLSPSIIGWVKESTGSLAGGLYAISALLVAGALLLLVNRPSQLRARDRARLNATTGNPTCTSWLPDSSTKPIPSRRPRPATTTSSAARAFPPWCAARPCWRCGR